MKPYEERLNGDDLLKPGTHATQHSGSDRYPYEVVSHTTFTSGKKAGLVKTVELRPLDAKRTDSNGMSESQRYEFTSNPDAETMTVRAHYRKDGTLLGLAAETYRSGGVTHPISPVVIGKARMYYDFSF